MRENCCSVLSNEIGDMVRLIGNLLVDGGKESAAKNSRGLESQSESQNWKAQPSWQICTDEAVMGHETHASHNPNEVLQCICVANSSF